MAFSADISAASGTPTAAGGGALTFSLTGYAGPGKSNRMETTSTPAAPYTLEFSHRTEGSSGSRRFVRTATFRKILINSAGTPIEGSVTLTARVPEDATITQTHIEEMISRVANVLAADATNRARFVRGEV